MEFVVKARVMRRRQNGPAGNGWPHPARKWRSRASQGSVYGGGMDKFQPNFEVDAPAPLRACQGDNVIRFKFCVAKAFNVNIRHNLSNMLSD